MKIYTKTGDKGRTSLLRGGRVSKHHPRVRAYGALDELNSWIGYIRPLNDDSEVEAVLARIQPLLHIASSDAAAQIISGEEEGSVPRIGLAHTESLEAEIDRFDEDLPRLESFILPGGSLVGAALHIARTICRRAERRLVELSAADEFVNPDLMMFINRLSDHLYTLARWTNWRAGCEETSWNGHER